MSHQPGTTVPRRPTVPRLLGIGLAVATGLMVPLFLEMAVRFGANVPQMYMARDYTIGVAWAAVLAVSILLLPVPARDRRALLVLWGAKCVVTLGFMLLYEFRYNDLDWYSYFRFTREAANPWTEGGIPTSGDLVVALAWLQDQVIPNSFHALKVTFSMIGLVAVYTFYRAGVTFQHGREDLRVLYALGLFPSILFWSSIFGKDPIVSLGIALYVYGVIGWVRRRRLGYLWVVAAGIAIGALIRFWLAPILLLPLALLAIRSMGGGWSRRAGAVFILAGLVWAVGLFTDRLRLESTEDLLSATNRMSQQWAVGGSAQQLSELTSIGGMVRFVPLGAFTALFRPLPGEIMNPFGLLAGLENLALLGLLAVALVRTRLRTLKDPLVGWAVVLVVTWASIYGFVSYQNLGTAVRFRLQILPVLIGLLLYLAARRTVPAAPFGAGVIDVRN